MMDHSQYGEQGHILRYFAGRTGRFLDIGANDGKTFSNTYAMAQQGWSGVCVDASPRAFDALKETHKGNERIQCIHAAMTNKIGTITLHEASDTLVSSLDPTQPVTWKNYGFEWREVVVPAWTMDMLFEKVGCMEFDCVSLDVEGWDVALLRQMDLDKMGCQLLCIEHGGRVAEIKSLCPGMKVLNQNDVNLIMAR